jgi:hypothetical protein
MDLLFALETTIENLVMEEWYLSGFLEIVLKAVIKGETFDDKLWESCRAILPAGLVMEFESAYQSGGRKAFDDRVAKLLRQIPQELKSAGMSRIKSLSSMSMRSPLADQLRSLRSVRGLFSSFNLDLEDLLQVAFAYKVIELMKPAAERAARISELSVAEASSAEADSYLEEACYCYFYQLDTACAITCRSVLEEVVERKISHRILDEWRSEQKKDGSNSEPTLGTLVYLCKNRTKKNEWRLPLSAFASVDDVIKIGNRAAHRQPISGSDAFDCLTAARKAVAEILDGH